MTTFLGTLRRWLNSCLRPLGVSLDRTDRPARFPPEGLIHGWDVDAGFGPMYARAAPFTLLGHPDAFILYQFAKQAISVPGDLAEIGVYRGGTAKLVSELMASTGKTFHLFDTFAGMPETDPQRDLHRAGDFADTSAAAVKKALEGAGGAIEMHVGFFPDTARGLEAATFSFVHVDVDIYRSVLDCCAFFYPRLTRGGVMVFDDYGRVSCPGAKLAVDEFFSDKPESPCYVYTGQCVVTKL